MKVLRSYESFNNYIKEVNSKDILLFNFNGDAMFVINASKLGKTSNASKVWGKRIIVSLRDTNERYFATVMCTSITVQAESEVLMQ